ncbi:3367_t:CDS:2, partial [Diversispora eburnea]
MLFESEIHFELPLDVKESSPKAAKARYLDHRGNVQSLEIITNNFGLKVNKSVADDFCLFMENGNSNNRNCGNHHFDTNENGKFFQGIANKLEQVRQNRVVLLDSSIYSDLGKMVKNTIEQFLGKPSSDDGEDNEGDEGDDDEDSIKYLHQEY